MPELHWPWLEIAILIPLLSSLIVSRIHDQERAHSACLVVSFLTLLATIGAWIDFARLHAFEAHDPRDLVGAVLHRNLFVLDELSAPLLALASLLYLMVVLSTLRTKVHRVSFGWMLFSEAILMATLGCREPWTLIALLALSTIPPWLEIRARGHSTRIYSIHMIAFVALLVVGQAIVQWAQPDSGLLLAGGALLTTATLLRSGIAPLHGWLTDLFAKATLGTALLFVTPMVGAYAFMRLVFPIAPQWALQSVAVVSLVTALYAGGMALVQKEARRFFAFLFLSQSSLVLVGMELATPIGLTGALLVWLSVGLSLGGFGITLRCVEARIGRIRIDRYHGLYEHVPLLAALFLVTGLASIGFPGTVGFVGAELLVEGAVTVYPQVGMLVVLAAALNGIAILMVYFRIFTGPRHSASIALRARWPERVAVLIMTALILGGGLLPQPGVTSRHHAATALIDQRSDSLESPETLKTSNIFSVFKGSNDVR